MSSVCRNRRILTREFLEANYPEKSVEIIAREVQCDDGTVRRYLKSFGLLKGARAKVNLPGPEVITSAEAMLKEINRLNDQATGILMRCEVLKMKYERLTGHDFEKESRMIEQIVLNHHSRIAEAQEKNLTTELDRIAAEG